MFYGCKKCFTQLTDGLNICQHQMFINAIAIDQQGMILLMVDKILNKVRISQYFL